MILINMCSAREGGAKTIANSFLNYLNSNSQQLEKSVVIFGPPWIGEKRLPENFSHVVSDYSGLRAIFFSSFWMILLCIKFKAEKVYSFSNINILLPVSKRVTYFHQYKLFTSLEIKTLIYYLLLIFQTKSTFVFQTEHVKDKFINMFPKVSDYKVAWPGVDLTYTKSDESIIKVKSRFRYKKKFLILPYTDIKSPHKNFASLIDAEKILEEENIEVLVTAPEPCNFKSNVFTFLGVLNRDQLFSLYDFSDGMIFPSKFETVGLPIYEYCGQKKPIFVGDFDYVHNIRGMFPSIGSIKIIDFDTLSFEDKDFLAENNINGSNKFVESEWHKII